MSILDDNMSMAIPDISNIGTAISPISFDYMYVIDAKCVQYNIDRFMRTLNAAYIEHDWEGTTSKYNELNLFYVALGIVKLYYYIVNTNSDISNFDDFVEVYEYNNTLSKLLCSDIDVRGYINKLKI